MGVGWCWENVLLEPGTSSVLTYLAVLISTSFCLHAISSYTISLVVLMFPKDFLSEVIYGLYSSGWLDNNYQILMVTFSNWLTCDALFWFIEFLFEITSSDQRAHSQLTTFCSTSHLLSIAQGCCSHNNTTERALRRDFTFKSRGRKSFQNVRDKKFTIGQDRQHTLQRPPSLQHQFNFKVLWNNYI